MKFDELYESIVNTMVRAGNIDRSKLKVPSQAKMAKTISGANIKSQGDVDALIAKTRDTAIAGGNLMKSPMVRDYLKTATPELRKVARAGIQAGAQVKRDIRMPKRAQRPGRDVVKQRGVATKHQSDLARYNTKSDK
jgi:hypothetical protein